MGINKKIIRIAAALVIFGIMQQHLVYAAETSTQLQSSALTETGDVNTDRTVQETAVTDATALESSDQGSSGLQTDATNLDADGQQTETSDTNTGEQITDTSDQNTGGQSGDVSDQDVDDQQSETSDQNMDDQQTDELQGNEEQLDDGELEPEDDDQWADGDDEWTDAWTDADDDMGSDWADDEAESDEDEIKSTDSLDSNEIGGEGYIAKSVISDTSSNSSQEKPDHNYRTGAGLGNDKFLILALVCGLAAIGLVVRKSMR